MQYLIFAVAAILSSANAFPGMGRSVERGLPVQGPVQPVAKRTSSTSSTTSIISSGYPAYTAPGMGDVRSPCPGLNAAANHNICPHNGKGYTIPILTSCLKEALNMGADFSLFVGAAGIGSNPNPLELTFDLDQLDHHDMVIEHDASLSRGDAYFGNNYSFNKTIWDTVLAYYDGMDETSIEVAAKAKYMRIQTEKARDPTFTYTPVQFIFSYGETAIYLSTMGDPVTGVAPIEYVRSLFEDETLPYDLGWRPTADPTTLASLAAMIFELNVANGEELPEGLTLTESTLKAALSGLDPVTGAVINPLVQTINSLLGITASS